MKKFIIVFLCVFVSCVSMDQSNSSVLAQFEELVRNKVDHTVAREHQLHEALHGVVEVSYDLAHESQYKGNTLHKIDTLGAAIASEFVLAGAPVCNVLATNIQLGIYFPTLCDVISTAVDLHYIASLDLTNEEQAQEVSRIRRTAIAILSQARENGKCYR